jgi:hypothetical protein
VAKADSVRRAARASLSGVLRKLIEIVVDHGLPGEVQTISELADGEFVLALGELALLVLLQLIDFIETLLSAVHREPLDFAEVGDDGATCVGLPRRLRLFVGTQHLPVQDVCEEDREIAPRHRLLHPVERGFARLDGVDEFGRLQNVFPVRLDGSGIRLVNAMPDGLVSLTPKQVLEARVVLREALD